MTAELTFAPGRVPGISRAPRRVVRRATPHAAAPVSPSDEAPPPMSASQRRALAALIHTPAGAGTEAYGRSRTTAGVVWAVVTACALAWTLTIAAALAP